MYGYRACRDCGIMVQRTELEAGVHECDRERYASHQMDLWRRELGHIEDALDHYLATNWGAFHAYLARREAA